jgi:DNA-binding NtrC family response regulator
VTDSIRVLIVGDTAEDRDSIDGALVAADFAVRRADAADAALGALAVQRPDVLVVDLRIPGTEGHHLLTALAERTSEHDIPVILMGELSNLMKPAPIVPFGLVPTPLDMDNLVATVRRVSQRGNLVGAI